MISAADVRHRIEYAGFRTAGWIFGSLPIERASALSGAIWRRLAPLTHRHTRAVRQLQRAFPDKTPADCDALARAMWEILGRTFAEGFHLGEIFDSDRLDLSALPAILTPEVKGGGFVLCAAHLGNWEVAVMGLVHLGVKPTGLYQRLKNRYVDRFVLTARERFYPAGLYVKGASSALPMVHNVRRGGCFAILADLREFAGVSVPFFGQPAPSTPLPASIARMLDVPMIAYFVERLPGVRFRITAERIAVPRTADREADILAATASLAAAFERAIRKHPEQWMWAHRRWG